MRCKRLFVWHMRGQELCLRAAVGNINDTVGFFDIFNTEPQVRVRPVKQRDAAAQYNRHNMQMEFINHSGSYKLIGEIGAAADPDMFA